MISTLVRRVLPLALAALLCAGCDATGDDALASDLDACPAPYCEGDAADASIDAPTGDDVGDAGVAFDASGLRCGLGACNPDLASSCGARAPADAGGVDGARAPDDDAGAEAGPAPEILGCRVRETHGVLSPVCEPAGLATNGEACSRDSECAPGLGCVGVAPDAACRPYCCGDPEGCPVSTYCVDRPAFDAAKSDAGASGPWLPVCVPVAPCELLGSDCPAALACTVVRADGTTACTVPGSGGLGESCPCAAGYVCARAQNVCLKLCHVAPAPNECAEGVCQGGSKSLPAGFGVCVGAVGDAG